MTNSHGIPAEQLLAHTEWVRALALRLVRDESHAEDLVQETWLQALRRPPRETRNLRGWLATILRNTARQMVRRDTRRQRHEAAASRLPVSPGTEQLEEEARLHRELVDRVLSLPELYRRILLLRYFEGLSPTEIGRRQGLSASTVRSRLQRGLAELRAQLDREYGNRLRWAALLVPLTRTRPIPAPSIPRLLPSVALGLVGLGVLTIAWLFLVPQQQTPVAIPGRDVTGMSAETPGGPAIPGESLPLPRQPTIVESEGDLRPPVLLSGRILDIEGRPLPSLLVALRGLDPATPDARIDPGTARDRSNPEGRFHLDLPPGVEPHRIELVVVGDNTATLGNFWRAPESEQIVVAAPSRALEGRVHDVYGGPLPGASVRVSFTIRGLFGFPLPTDDSIASADVSALTDTAGYFVLKGIPDLPGLYVSVRTTGYAPESRPLPRGPLPSMDIGMEPRTYPGQPLVGGMVLSAEGDPMAGASVSFGAVNTTVTDAAGQFSMVVHPAGPPWIYVSPPDREQLETYDLIAVATGHQPVVLPGFGLRLLEGENLDHVLLRLGPRPLTLRGRVVDEEGAPWPDVRLELVDPTRHLGGSLTAEQVAGGRPGRVHTDGEGVFTMTGLRDRDYTLRIVDPATTSELTAGPFHASEQDLELMLSRSDLRAPVSGTVTGYDGRPLSGVAVAPVLPGTEFRPETGKPVFTDGEGHFTLGDLPRGRRLILLRHPGYSSETIELDTEEDGIPPIVMQPVARVRILAPAARRPIRLTAKDAEGQELRLIALRLDGSMVLARTLPLPADEPLPICQLPVSARTLFVEFEDGSTQKISLELTPGELKTLTL